MSSMPDHILKLAIVVAASLGDVTIYSVSQHPSGAFMIFTSEGKKYLELTGDEKSDSEINAAILDVLAPIVGEVVTEQEKPVAAPKGKATPKAKTPIAKPSTDAE